LANVAFIKKHLIFSSDFLNIILLPGSQNAKQHLKIVFLLVLCQTVYACTFANESSWQENHFIESQQFLCSFTLTYCNTQGFTFETISENQG